MNEKKSGIVVNLVMIITSFCLMQWHSIQFWLSAAGPSGWAWSIGLEIAMLCLWYDRKHRFLKYIAALILIAGPWYQMTSPTIRNIQIINEIEIEIEIDIQRLDQLSKSLATYQANSRQRLGWRDEIRETESAINELSPQIKELHSKLSKQNSSWREYMVTGVQSAALLIILVAQLSAVSNLGNQQISDKTKPGKTIHSISKPKRLMPEISGSNFEDFNKKVAIVATEITLELSNYNSQKSLSEALDIGQKSISLILNHEKRKLSGTECISLNALNKVMRALEIHRK